MKTSIKTLTFLLISMILSVQAFAQPPVQTTASTQCASAPSAVTVNITVANFTAVASTSLALNYNTANLIYTGFTANPALAGGMTMVNATGGQVKAANFGLNPVTLPDGSVLFTFTFTFNGGNNPLVWDLATPGNCTYSDVGGVELPAEWFDGAVNESGPAPSVTTNPVNASIFEGSNASFSIAASNATNYLWQESINNGNTWTDLTDGGVYSGTTTATLDLTSVPISMNLYQYRCKAYETNCNQSTFSGSATLTVNPMGNSISTTASSVTGCPGSTVIVPIMVDNFDDVYGLHLTLDFNPAHLSYTGYQGLNSAIAGAQIMLQANSVEMNWVNTSPANIGTGTLVELMFTYIMGTPSLTWNSTPGMNTYTGIGGSNLTANFFNGTISPLVPAPSFTLQPIDQSINLGANATFTVAASTATLAWQESIDNGATWTNLTNSATYNGVTTNTLTINAAPFSMNGYQYRCAATEATCNQVTHSNVATLTVIPAGNAIITNLGNVVTCPGGIIQVPVNVLNFYDVASASMRLSYDTTVLKWDTAYSVTNVHPALATGYLSENALNGEWSFAWFNVTPASFASGKLFDIQFEYKENSSVLVWNPDSTICVYTDLFGFPLQSVWNDGSVSLPGPVILTHPANASVAVNTDAIFTITGTNITAYQWQESTNGGQSWADLVDGPVYSGTQTATLTINDVTFSLDTYKYRCNVDGTCGLQHSNAATLAVVSAVPVLTTAPSITGCQGSVTVPINVTDLNNFGSFTLKLDYTGTYLTYINYTNVNTALTGTLTVVPSPGSILITYVSGVMTNIGTGLLLDLVFNSNPGTSDLNWDLVTSHYLTPGGSILPASFTNGVVNISPVPGFPGSITGPNNLCQGVVTSQFTTSGAQFATSYIWELLPNYAGTVTGTGTTATVNWDPIFNGVVTVTVKGANNCGTGSPNGKTVTINPTPIIVFPNPDSVCDNTAAFALTGASPAGGTYSGTGVANNEFDPSVSGVGTFNIIYTYTNQYGCTGKDTAQIVVSSSPVVSLTMPTYVCINWPPYALTGGSPAGGTYSGPGVNSATGTFNPGTVGSGIWNITYTYQNAAGCQDFAVAALWVSPCTGIGNPTADPQILVQPNPNQGLFNLELLNLNQANNLEISNAIGEVVYKESLDGSAYKKQIDLSTQPVGMYFIKVTGAGILKIEKIVLQ